MDNTKLAQQISARNFGAGAAIKALEDASMDKTAGISQQSINDLTMKVADVSLRDAHQFGFAQGAAVCSVIAESILTKEASDKFAEVLEKELDQQNIPVEAIKESIDPEEEDPEVIGQAAIDGAAEVISEMTGKPVEDPDVQIAAAQIVEDEISQGEQGVQ